MQAMGYDGGLDLIRPPDNAQKLDEVKAMRLLATAAYGRVVFTRNALPAIRPVNHLVDDGTIIIRTRLTTAISAAVRSATALIVAYEADSFDDESRTGWSVVVTGRAHAVSDADQISRYEKLLHPWVNRADNVLAIEPDIVTGFRVNPRQT
jgi:nitroimidazol reductase NimA-like FMN-containing flavoprotein (pyridoxamine 5'-phosphate oxidase superfamily)